MGKTRLQKLLAVLLAGGIALTSSGAIAKEKGKSTSTKPATTVEEATETQELNEFGLTAEYMSCLTQNKIDIIDGNIIADTEEKIEVIAEYFYSLQEKCGAENVDMIGIRDFIIAFNQDISGKIKDSLAAQKKITFPLPNYLSPKKSKFTDFWQIRTDLNQKLILEGNKNEMFTLLPIIFDNKARLAIRKIEEYDRYYATISASDVLEGNKSKAETDKKLEEYSLGMIDIYNFFNNIPSTFPVAFSDIPDCSQYLLYYSLEQFTYTIYAANGLAPSTLEEFLYSDIYRKSVSEKIEMANNQSYANVISLK